MAMKNKDEEKKSTYFVHNMDHQKHKEDVINVAEFIKDSDSSTNEPKRGTYFVRNMRSKIQLRDKQKSEGQSFDAPTRNATLAQPSNKITKTEIFRNFHQAAEYNTPWLDVGTQRLTLEDGEVPLLGQWTPLNIIISKSFYDRFKSMFGLMFYFGIYALIMFFWEDGMSIPLNYSLPALFLPILPYILASYRSLEFYFRALFATVLILVVYAFLLSRNKNYVEWEGIVFLKYFSFLLDWFPSVVGYLPDLDIDVSQLSTHIEKEENWLPLTMLVILILFVMEFVLLIINWIFSKPPKIEIVITQKNIFFRQITRKSTLEIIKMLFYIAMNPFNIKQYADIRDRIRYNQVTEKEGRKYDFSKIPIDSIRALKKNKNSFALNIFISIAMIIIGGITFLMVVGIPILLFGFIFLAKSISGLGTYSVKIAVNRKKVEGSWILSHTSDIFAFNTTPTEVAQYFTNIKR
jgi:hypothetical protein